MTDKLQDMPALPKRAKPRSAYEVKKVANGYLVTPANNLQGDEWAAAQVHVFASWDEASTWLRDQFEATS